MNQSNQINTIEAGCRDAGRSESRLEVKALGIGGCITSYLDCVLLQLKIDLLVASFKNSGSLSRRTRAQGPGARPLESRSNSSVR